MNMMLNNKGQKEEVLKEEGDWNQSVVEIS